MKASDEITEEQSREVRVVSPFSSPAPVSTWPAVHSHTLRKKMLFDIESAYQEFFAALK
jgi:hypothetical protein